METTDFEAGFTASWRPRPPTTCGLCGGRGFVEEHHDYGATERLACACQSPPAHQAGEIEGDDVF